MTANSLGGKLKVRGDVPSESLAATHPQAMLPTATRRFEDFLARPTQVCSRLEEVPPSPYCEGWSIDANIRTVLARAHPGA